ncbi:pentatricopeptide repeat-containing protein-like [Iris pallida]|uniref:Pentatricopeptide repeat-containing protein-like n=1 Tax=Iris pallida TaxID=29817 RepID=A0AAX6GSY7_IRIPA|nr:pentatricopeptide repeat-containing protein-like [Iris pallida]KAJ6840936.1 pentatricopeptide repeat-containing protein-like [Iris pallida]
MARSSTLLLHDLILHSQSLSQTKQAHAQSLFLNLLHHDQPTILSSLILSYSTFNSPSSSLLLFHSHSPSPSQPPTNAFLHNSLLRALSKSKLHSRSLSIYNSMLRLSVPPDHRTFPFALTACSADPALLSLKGLELHASLLKLGFASDVFVSNTLLSFYASIADLPSVCKVFDEMPHRDVVSWNSAISASSLNARSSDSLRWFAGLLGSGFAPNSVSLVSVLPSVAVIGDAGFGEGVHGYAVKSGLGSHVSVGNALVDMYGKCGDWGASVRMFREMPERNDVSWNSVIGGLVHAGYSADSVRVFRDMMDGGVKPNSVTVSSLLPALVELGCFELGREVHGRCVRTGMDSDVFVANSLLYMYAKSGCLKKASSVFFGMERRNEVSWNAMIANFTQNGAEFEAVRLVIDMQASGERPNAVTFTNVLPACARMGSLEKGKEMHAMSIRDGSYLDLFVSNALIDMYAKCGRLKFARSVFEVSERDQVSYNTLIVGYSQSAQCAEALVLFTEMEPAGLERDVVSFMGVLSACSNLSALKQGKEIHCLSVRKLFNAHLFVANALLDLYTKCGRIDLARKIFDRIPNRDVASWNSMILGYGMQGELEAALNLFDTMGDDGVRCDHVSYIAILSICSHGGLVERGRSYFEKMLAQNIRPTQMHYANMVDLLGRAGLLKEAADFIKEMPFEADSNVWGALLGACRVHGNVELGRWAAEHLFELKPGHCGYYSLLSNMYAEAGRWEEANEIRELMKSRRVRKNPGCSWVHNGNGMHAFIVGERIEAIEPELSYAES